MFLSLKSLRNNIDRLIAEQGDNAMCCGIIYTKEDVTDCFDCMDESLPEDHNFITEVLADLGESDAIYDYINDKMDDSIRDNLRQYS